MRIDANGTKGAALRAQNIDLDLIERVQNPVGTAFHTDYFTDGNTTSAILNVYDFPKSKQAQGWFRQVVTQNNAIVQLKIGTEKRIKVQKALQSNQNGLRDKVNSDLTSPAALTDAVADLEINQQDLDDLLNGHEVYKRLYIRLIISDLDYDRLRKRIKNIQDSLSNFRLKVYPSEQYNHFQQFFVPAMEIENRGIKDRGFPMKAYALAGSYPFNQTFVNHPRGAYMGLTRQQGEVMYDPSYNDGKTQLTAYNLIIGAERSGKSSWGKKNVVPLIVRGDTVWVFDRSNEWTRLVETYGGVHLTLDGSQNRVNLLEIQAAATLANGQVDVMQSFTLHKTKIRRYYATLKPDTPVEELNLLEDLLTNFYIDKKMWLPHPEDHLAELKIINLPAKDYPILDDFVTYLNGQLLQPDYSANKRAMIERVHSQFKYLVDNYGAMTNGPTTVPDLSEMPLIRFDTSGLSRLDTALYNAQYFTILSLMESYVVMNGQQQRARIERRELTGGEWHPGMATPKYFWWIQDEADDIFNAKHPMGVEFGDQMMAQHGKDFFGNFVIAPGLKNFVFSGQTQDSAGTRAAKSFVGRFNKKIIGRLSQQDTDSLRQVVSEQEITDSQLSTIQTLDRGNFLLDLVGKQSVLMEMDLNDYEQELFGGGL